MRYMWKTVMMADMGVWVDSSHKLLVKSRRCHEFRGNLSVIAGEGV